MHADDAILVLLKDNRKNEYLDDDAKKLQDSYLLEPENKSLNDYITCYMLY